MGQDADSDLCLALLHGPEQIADLPVPVVESPGAVVELVGYDYRRRVVAARRIHQGSLALRDSATWSDRTLTAASSTGGLTDGGYRSTSQRVGWLIPPRDEVTTEEFAMPI